MEANFQNPSLPLSQDGECHKTFQGWLKFKKNPQKTRREESFMNK